MKLYLIQNERKEQILCIEDKSLYFNDTGKIQTCKDYLFFNSIILNPIIYDQTINKILPKHLQRPKNYEDLKEAFTIKLEFLIKKKESYATINKKQFNFLKKYLIKLK